MGLRRLAWLIGAATLAGTGGYLFVYLYRWEWNRALICGVLFLAAQIVVATSLITSRIRRVENRLPASGARERSVLAHLADARDEPSQVFAWLRPDPSRTSVFVPILMGAGLVLSGLAWVVERVARATAGTTVDESVAAHLARLGPPGGGFLDDRRDPLRTLRGPAGARR